MMKKTRSVPTVYTAACILSFALLAGNVLLADDAILLRPKWQVGKRYVTKIRMTEGMG